MISPATAATDRTKKLQIYARQETSHAWLVDPIACTLEVLRLDTGPWTILSTWSGLAIVRPEPFDAIDLDLSLLWEDASG